MAKKKTTYLLRDIDVTFWSCVKAKAAHEQISVKALLVKLLSKWLGVLLLVLLTSAPLSAQSLKLPAIVLGAAGAADIGTTVWFMNHSDLTEVNPLVNWIKAPIPMVAFGAAVESAAITLITRKIAKRHPKWAATGLYVAAGIHAGLAIHNVRNMKEWQRLRR